MQHPQTSSLSECHCGDTGGGRYAQVHSHDVKIISPRKVKAYLQGQKTDANDAVAIAVAASQVGMIFSQLKSEQQQILQSIESTRRFLDKQRVALVNHMRAYLYEFGMTSARGQKGFKQLMLNVLDDEVEGLPISLKPPLQTMWDRYQETLNMQHPLKNKIQQYVMGIRLLLEGKSFVKLRPENSSKTKQTGLAPKSSQ